MKKIIFLAIFMVVWANGMFAQTEDDITIVDTEVESPQDTIFPSNPLELWKQFQSYLTEAQKSEQTPLRSVPIIGKNKFVRSHYINQRLEISAVGGKDKDGEDSDNVPIIYKSDDDVEEAAQDDGNFNYGLNVGYSLIFVPGRINNDMLELNRLGFGYSLGIVASFDRQKYYGVTCDFLGKIGLETGHGHKMGLGFDFLLGTGKSAGEYRFLLNENDEKTDANVPYTAWCLKYGAQFWVRSNLIQASVKNTDVRLFARYVYSKNPEGQNSQIACIWYEESWSFGMTFCYGF